jgi:5S rRNA maturation endonuclease (ribonuclease M5)
MLDEVFPIIWYKIYSKKLKEYVVIRPNTRAYLVGNFDERKKFYTPDKKGKGKWATNCTQNDIWGIKDLPLKGKTLIISKSYKDYRVLKNQGLVVIAFQNEGMMPNDEILKPLLERFEEVIVLFDNDRAGIESAEKVVDYINGIYPRKARYVHLDMSLQKQRISDPADLIKLKGKKPLTEFLMNNNLIK